MKIIKPGREDKKPARKPVVCENCEAVLEVNEHDLTHTVFLTYVICPECQQDIIISGRKL